MRGVRIQQRLAQIADIGAGRHRELDLDAALVVAHRHVAHGLGDQLGVGHDQRRLVPHLDFGRAQADAADVAFLITPLHPGADLHRARGQQDQPGHEVLACSAGGPWPTAPSSPR
ncbi:hypothetical protein G6F68_019133 [Rhizopus microsporus]|nr:hypothetical protein G6F68_019133 [Rhizopus microsporus]